MASFILRTKYIDNSGLPLGNRKRTTLVFVRNGANFELHNLYAVDSRQQRV